MDESEKIAVHESWQDGPVSLVGNTREAPNLPRQLRRCAMKRKPPNEKGGGNENAARLISNRQCSLCHERFDVKTYGPPELCAWSVGRDGHHDFWLQTTDRKFARKLAKRGDACRVGITGDNHFRQTFQICGTWRKVRRIIERYILSAGDHISATTAAQDRSKSVQRVKTADALNCTPKSVPISGGAEC